MHPRPARAGSAVPAFLVRERSSFPSFWRDTNSRKLANSFRVAALTELLGLPPSGRPAQNAALLEATLATDIYNGADPTTVPIYSVGEVAHHLDLPPSTVRAWVKSRGGPAPFQRVIIPDDEGVGSQLSFRNLVEVHVLSSIRRYGIPLPQVRTSIGVLRQYFETDHPLAEIPLHTDRANLFVLQMGSYLAVNRGGQAAIGPVVESYLERIERDPEGLLTRLYPFLGNQRGRVVAIDPRRRFGRPYLADVGVETAAIASRYHAGDSIAALARDFDTTQAKIKGALRFEKALQEAA